MNHSNPLFLCVGLLELVYTHLHIVLLIQITVGVWFFWSNPNARQTYHVNFSETEDSCHQCFPSVGKSMLVHVRTIHSVGGGVEIR